MKGPRNGMSHCLLDSPDPEASVLTHEGEGHGLCPRAAELHPGGPGACTGPTPMWGFCSGLGQGLSCPSGVSCHLLEMTGAEKGQEAGEQGPASSQGTWGHL